MKKTLLSVALTIMATITYAGHGFYADGGSFVNFNANNAGFINYKVGRCSTCGALPAFNSANLGTNLTSLVLGTIEQNTYENGGDDVLDNGSFYYVIYPTGSRPGAPVYTAVVLSNAVYNNGGTGNEKRTFTPAQQLINGLASLTNYTIEVYYQSNVTYNGGSTGHTISTQAAGGTNYDAAPTLFTATFTTGTVLAEKNIQLTSTLQNGQVTVNWSLDDETGIANYSVEKATDAEHFADIATFPQQQMKNYFYADANANANGLVYYRLKLTYASGKIVYSNIIKASPATGESKIAVSCFGNSIMLKLKNLPAKNYKLMVVNYAGQQVFSTLLSHDGNNKTVSIPMPVALQGGVIYRLILKDERSVFNESFIKYAK